MKCPACIGFSPHSPRKVSFWVQIPGVVVSVTHCVPQWEWLDYPLARSYIADPVLLLHSVWEEGAPRPASGSNPSCPSSHAPVALNPIPNTVHSRTVQACPLKRGMKMLKLK